MYSLALVPLILLVTAAEPPNVLLLSVDTLRADRLGCYGYGLDTSPNIDGLAAESLLFEDCVCEVPLTSPSMVSMFTSRYPRLTGTTRNGLRLSEDVPTIAEAFREAGFYTFCVQSNWTLKDKLCGLGRGFDVYDDDFHQKRWGIIKAERLAEEVTEAALRRFAERDPERPFFAWVHYTDPHAPYEMHGNFNPSEKRAWRLKKREKVSVKYDSEVAFTDHHIAHLLEALPENTAIVFVADHGESLYEHDYLGHGRRIFQTGLHIPLMVRAPGLTPGRTQAPARGIDVGPTLLGLAGLEKTPQMLGVDLLREPPPMERVRVIETYGGAVPRLPGAKAVMAGAGPMRQGVLVEGWKLILNGRKRSLFHLPEDSGELEDFSDKQPERVDELEALVARWNEDMNPGREIEHDLDQDDIKALEALGYLE